MAPAADSEVHLDVPFQFLGSDSARIAILDVDGTLLPGTLGLRLLRELADRSPDRARAVHAVLDLHADYVRGHVEYGEMASAAIGLYGQALRGLPCSTEQDMAARVWAELRVHLFDFVRPLIRLLRRHSVETVIVSGSPESVVHCLAATLGVRRYRGSRFSVTDGTYDGTGYDSPHFDGKDNTVRALCPDLPINWSASLGIGNSPGDIPVLSAVGHSFVFEPEPGLRGEAMRRNWQIVHRADVLASVSEVLLLPT